jgi:hypothetical protein
MLPIRDPPTTENSIGVPVSTFRMRDTLCKMTVVHVIGSMATVIVWIMDPQIVERLVMSRCFGSGEDGLEVLGEPRIER